MSKGLIGRKAGMMRVFREDGASVPVTVIEVTPNHVTQVKTTERDGYVAIQVSAGKRKPSRVSKPMAGHFASAGVAAGNVVREFRLASDEAGAFEPGAELGLDMFSEGQKVDVRGVTKGKGFAGGIKRHNFRGQDNTHGNSLSHRAPGSIGQCQTPGRVFKGKRMAGQMGNVNRCQQGLEVVRVDAARNLILIRGGVPGPAGGQVVIVPSVKQKTKG
jgi:large subunit ribosomal protein L3